VVGCGLGADAEFMAGLGFTKTAFDVSPTAIQLAREHYPRTAVRYVTADLLHVPAAWQHAFDLVVEIITLQALPPELHPAPQPPSESWSLAAGRCSLSGRYPTRASCRHRGHSLAPRSKASHPTD
jgi:methyltransferase family protein